MTRIHRSLAAASLLVAAFACGQSSGAASNRLKVPADGSPQRGPADAWVTVVEFADFQCSFCRSEEPVVADLLAIYPDDLRLVFKNFPLTAIHGNAQAAAVAAECAGEQDRFWQMHDLLFTTGLDSASLLADAGQISGLDVTAWQACLLSQTPLDVISRDLALASSLDIPGTPTFVVNGWPAFGALPESDLRAIVDRARTEAVASGIPRAEYYQRAVLGN